MIIIIIIVIISRLSVEIIDDLSSTYGLSNDETKWISRVISYNVSGGKMNRGLSVVSACKTFALTKGHDLSVKVSDRLMIDGLMIDE